MNIFKVPYDGVISIEACSGGFQTYVPQEYGFFNLDINRIIYYRDQNEHSGLIRVDSGVDIVLNREWYGKLINVVESYSVVYN